MFFKSLKVNLYYSIVYHFYEHSSVILSVVFSLSKGYKIYYSTDCRHPDMPVRPKWDDFHLIFTDVTGLKQARKKFHSMFGYHLNMCSLYLYLLVPSFALKMVKMISDIQGLLITKLVEYLYEMLASHMLWGYFPFENSSRNSCFLICQQQTSYFLKIIKLC